MLKKFFFIVDITNGAPNTYVSYNSGRALSCHRQIIYPPFSCRASENANGGDSKVIVTNRINTVDGVNISALNESIEMQNHRERGSYFLDKIFKTPGEPGE